MCGQTATAELTLPSLALVEKFSLDISQEECQQLLVKYDLKGNGDFAYCDFLQSCILLLKAKETSLVRRMRIQNAHKMVRGSPQGAPGAGAQGALIAPSPLCARGGRRGAETPVGPLAREDRARLMSPASLPPPLGPPLSLPLCTHVRMSPVYGMYMYSVSVHHILWREHACTHVWDVCEHVWYVSMTW